MSKAKHNHPAFPGALPLFAAAICLLFSAPTSQAQEPETISIRFQTLSWQDSINDLYYFDAGNPVSLFIPNGAPGAKLSYSGPPVMGFYKQRTGPEGEVLYDRIASVNLSPGQRQCLLLFIPVSGESGEKQPYRILPLTDTNRDFGPNAFNIYNLTRSTMAIRLGEEQFRISPGGNHVVQPAELGTKNVDVQMAANAQDTNWTLIYQSRWATPGKRRAWVFIYQDADSKPSIRKYYQIAQTTPTPEL